MKTDREQAQAVVNAMYDACKYAIESHPDFLPPRDYFDKLLGDTAQSYAIRDYEEITAKRDRLQAAVDKAHAALVISQYRAAMEALGEVVTQHTGTG